MNTQQPGTIAVLDGFGILTEHYQRYAIAPATSLSELLTRARAREISQLWIHNSHALVLSLDEARAAGWIIQQAGKYAVWYTCYQRGTYGAVSLVMASEEDRVPWRDAETGFELLEALLAYRGNVGVPYAYSPGATGAYLLRSLHSGRGTLDLTGSIAPADMPAPAHVPGVESDLFWMRPLTDDERGHTYLHSYDKNAMYLAAASSIALGFGVPEHWTGAAAHPASWVHPEAGYWYVQMIAGDGDAALPPLYSGRGRWLHEPVWVTTPTLMLLHEHGAIGAIGDAWIWPETHYPLTSWQRRMKQARIDLSAPSTGNALALDALKATYTQTIGSLDGHWLRESDEPADLFRPDWRHAIIATARCNLWRNAAKAALVSGRAPFAVGTDALYYTSDDPDPIAANPGLTLGGAIGNYKVKDAAVPLDDVRELLDGVSRDPRRALHALQTALNERKR